MPGPVPFSFTVYGVDGEELPQIEEHPVAFAMYILSPNSCVISFAYGVSPQPAHAPENSSSGCLELGSLNGILFELLDYISLLPAALPHSQMQPGILRLLPCSP